MTSGTSPNIAYQCERREGYRLTPNSVIVEVLRHGLPVAAGETGELVVTVLRNRMTPFIRYNLRDLGALAAEPCACGRSTPLLQVIAGRTDDFIILPDGREHVTRRLGECLGPARLDVHVADRLADDPSGKLRAIVSKVAKGSNAP